MFCVRHATNPPLYPLQRDSRKEAAREKVDLAIPLIQESYQQWMAVSCAALLTRGAINEAGRRADLVRKQCSSWFDGLAYESRA